jgi:hypothetical protein
VSYLLVSILFFGCYKFAGVADKPVRNWNRQRETLKARVSLPETVFPPGGGGEILKLGELFRVAEWHERLAWKPFRQKVEIYRLYGEEFGPRAALLRFQPGGRVPLHEHTGYEHILVLAGSQEDDTGLVKAGDLVINARARATAS